MDSSSKLAWEAVNMVQCTIKINKNQDPELYRILTEAPSVSGAVREMLRAYIKEHPQK